MGTIIIIIITMERNITSLASHLLVIKIIIPHG
jgi:hypothetical protein